jgi:hypothetical protein
MRMDWAGTATTNMIGVTSPASGGALQSRRTNTAASQYGYKTSVRAWAIRWSGATRAERDAIYDVWSASFGGAVAINFVPPDGTTLLARIIGGPFRERQIGPQLFDISLELEEVI